MRAARKRETFGSWCRRLRIQPGDPTPAVSSWHGDRFSTETFSTVLKGAARTVPALTTTVEVFCLRTGRIFRARGSAVRRERYESPGWVISHYRMLVACKHCPDTHVLLTTHQAASFELIGDPVGGPRITKRDRAFGRRSSNSEIFNRKRFPPVKKQREAA